MIKASFATFIAENNKAIAVEQMMRTIIDQIKETTTKVFFNYCIDSGLQHLENYRGL